MSQAASVQGSRDAAPGAFLTLGRTVVRFRWVVVVVWVAAAAVLPGALPSLSSASKSENTAFLPSSTPVVRASKLAAPFQRQNSAGTLLIAGRSEGALSTTDESSIAAALRAVAAVPEVRDVRDRGLSRDGSARLALVELKGVGARSGGGTKVFDRLHAAAAGVHAPGGLGIHFAGELAQSVDANAKQSHTQQLTELLSIAFIVVLLLVVFRAVLAPLVTLLPAVLALVIAGPLIGEAAKAGLEVSDLTQLLLIVIVLGAGTDYGLFLIFRVREGLAHGVAPREAVIDALSRVGKTITFSALTVIVALVSVILAKFGLYRGLGPGLAIGIVVTLLAGLTLLPALLAIFGRKVMWPSKPRPGHEYQGAWGALAARVVAKPRRTLAVVLTVFALLALAVLAYSPAGFGSQSAPSGSDSSAGAALLDAHFPVSVRNPTNVVMRLPASVLAHPGTLAAASAALGRERAFTGVSGGLDPNGTRLSTSALLRLYAALGPPRRLPPIEPAALAARVPRRLYAAYAATSQFISPDGRTLQFYVTLRAGDPASTAALNAIPSVRAAATRAARAAGASDSGVAGEASAAYDVSQISTSDLQLIIPVVLVVIAILLAILLRSLIAPLYLIASVGLSYLASLGLAVLLFVKLGGASGLSFVLPFFMFVFLMALGEDYNILVITRIREEATHADLPTAVRRAIAASGGTVTSAGLVLAGTFAVLTIAGDTQTREIGLGLAAGVLLDTFLVRTLLIPSLVVLLGRWNWWPSQVESDAAPAGAPGHSAAAPVGKPAQA
ncbi:MAG: MMPL family transporter [Solirubrobacteraceae bacterium]